MTEVKCQKCGNPNSTAENFCLNCGNSLLNMQPPVYAPLASPQPQPNQPYQSYGFNVPSHFSAAQQQQPAGDNPLGRNVYIAYKIFCGAAVLLSLLPIFLGVIAIIGSGDQPTPKERQDAFNGAIMFIVYGLLFLVPYTLGLILPRARWHWVLGIVLLALSLIPIGFTSCVFIPAAIALLIYWFKPETKAYFGRA